MRVIGSPDPYAAHIDGMGGATSSTSKCVILSKSSVPDHDVDYLYGQVSIDKAFVDWSGNCGNLSTAAGAFAIHAGLVDSSRIPDNGTCVVRIWQANIQKTIIAHIPVTNGQVQETGDFDLDGVTFPAAEIILEFMNPSDDSEEGGSMFPTGNLVDDLEVPGIGTLKATMITAGIPTVFVRAEDIGYTGTELREQINYRCGRTRNVRKNSRSRRTAHGPHQNTRRSHNSPAHTKDCLRFRAKRLRVIKR
jgi:2-methylaconitate cis-trans-isomerase PrpF